MSNYPIPSLGSSGTFELAGPFVNDTINKEKYTCQAIRSIADYISNNEDPYKLIYEPKQITKDEYDEDVRNNMLIASLQAPNGHWIYVPIKYIKTYPLVNGIAYKTFNLVVRLPALPVDKDIDFIKTSIINLMQSSIGVNCIVTKVDTSRVIMVTPDIHDSLTIQRNLLTQGNITDYSRWQRTQQDLQTALTKIRELEEYIKNNI
jgi:hypothetical protein